MLELNLIVILEKHKEHRHGRLSQNYIMGANFPFGYMREQKYSSLSNLYVSQPCYNIVITHHIFRLRHFFLLPYSSLASPRGLLLSLSTCHMAT